jgi:hypothetical protein
MWSKIKVKINKNTASIKKIKKKEKIAINLKALIYLNM